jgi:hypothetical protein
MKNSKPILDDEEICRDEETSENKSSTEESSDEFDPEADGPPAGQPQHSIDNELMMLSPFGEYTSFVLK